MSSGGGPRWALALVVVALAGALGQQQRRFAFPQPIANLAVSRGRLLVAGGNCLYEVAAAPSLRRRGPFPHCVEPREARNKLLLPFGPAAEAERDRLLLLTCWTRPSGACYLGTNTSTAMANELVSCLPHSSAAGLVYEKGGDWFLVVATIQRLNDSAAAAAKCAPSLSEATTAISIVKDGKVGEGQSLKLASADVYLYFVDAFHWNGRLFFPYYHYYDRSRDPQVLILEQEALVKPYGQTALRCANRTRILSSVRVQQRGLWIGIFGSAAVGGGGRTPTSTAVCIFDLKRVLVAAKGCFCKEFSLEDFAANLPQCEHHETCQLINQAPSLNHSDLVSVYATVILEKIVLFLGTGNGQLLKVVLDENMKPNCPEILYETVEETTIFHKLELDPEDNNYIYLPSNKEIWRIPVANCHKYISCKDCLSALDPYCGWCYVKKRCTLKRDCSYSNNSWTWADTLYGRDKCLKIHISEFERGEISVTAIGDIPVLSEQPSICKVINNKTNTVLCEKSLVRMNCSCHLNMADLTDSVFQVILIAGSWNISEMLEINHCSLQQTCSECDQADCTWNAKANKCASSPVTCKQKINCDALISASNERNSTQTLKPMPNISIKPTWMSTLGRSEVLVSGENFTASNILMEITGTSSCKPDVIPVSQVLNDTHLKFCLPPSRKEAKSVCVKADGFRCSPPVTLYYVSIPACSNIFPNVSWMSGGRKMTIHGRNLNLTDKVIISNEQNPNLSTFECLQDSGDCSFKTPDINYVKGNKNANVVLVIENEHLLCSKIQYHTDPEFIYYELATDMEPDLELKIHKANDNLNISRSEIEVTVSHLSGKSLRNITFTVQNMTKTATRSTIHCRAKRENNSTDSKIDKARVKVYVKLGNFRYEVPNESPNYSYLFILLFIPVVVVVAVLVTQSKSKQFNRKLSEHLELLECDVRKQIREGFVELQMDKLDVVDSFGTIPFLDYKHFVLRTFFPESGSFASTFIADTNEPLNRNPGHKDESTAILFALICNKNFLVALIHTLEKQKTFSVKDRCLFASFLTIALQTNLVYLTRILEVLTRDLMEQSSNIQPKLMLRRTESVVEKLLTNWMSVCLSGFLRETVGEPFYSLVTTLNQRIIKGPVDVITCKALYTLNEDWLLWQVTEFSTLALNVVFENILDNEGEDAHQTIQVDVLDCDTIGQAKEKILQAFLNKKGSLYGLRISEMGLALQSGAQMKELLDTDSSSVILEDGITKLNTMSHYEILDGATVKVFKRATNQSGIESNGSWYMDKNVTALWSYFPDAEGSGEYCHLILPDSEAAKDTQGAKHKGKQKFKVKEMYLTKLLSTKVAIHSVVEKLFRSIWTLPNNKVPVAIKYFFDFLDAQAENKKITDPDVVHIWKTNSLPLRFWVNILKNPQFVFDIKKTPHIDGCLSVIAQAFMDAFSLSEHQLGKESPTNKLLYAKDIPLYKEEVKTFYKVIRDLPPLSTSELEEFLTQESKKHENEFNESMALTEIYRYIARYFDEILNKLEKEPGLEETQKQLLNLKALADEKKKCKWISDNLSDP